MHVIHAIAVVIAGLFTTAMADALLRIMPRGHTAIDVIRIRVHTRARGHRRLDERRDRQVLDVFQHPQDHITATRDSPHTRRLLGSQRAASPLALEPSAPAASPFWVTTCGLPWWPATISTSSHAPSSVQVGDGFLATMLWRN